MNSQREALEYHVAPDGRVDTNGLYRIVPEEQWFSLPPLRTVRQTRYKRMLADLRQGLVVAIPAADRKKAWDRRKGLMHAAERAGMTVHTKTVVDPERPGSILVLARQGTPTRVG